MNFLKPRLFLIGFLPGFTYLVGILFIYKGYNYHSVLDFSQKNLSVPFAIAIVILSFIVGQVFDSFRDYFIEKHFEKYCKRKKIKDINWDFFYKATDDKIDRLDNNYYLFYVLNLNLMICFLVLVLIALIDFSTCLKIRIILSNPISIIIQLVISIAFLFLDARVLRKDIAEHTNTELKNKPDDSAS